jgi:hypothetical protein
MTEAGELLKLRRQLEELQRTRPEVYDLIRDALALPPAEYEEFMRQAMPILKKYMN